VYMEQTSVSNSQRNMNHARYREMANTCSSLNLTADEILSKMSWEIQPDLYFFKNIEKQIIKKIWNLDSTEKLSSKQIDILMNMWIKGLGENFNIELTTPEDYE